MTSPCEELTIRRGTGDFENWDDLLALILSSFAYMNGRIDPPSSALLLSPEGLRQKCATETVILAFLGKRLVGCAFLAMRSDHAYLGKLAVAPELQGRGIGKKLLTAAERHARAAGVSEIELQTRIELTENHLAFARLGFRETARTAHPGYDRATALTMRKALV
jgi:N-acetylglutamate synthase-like GNAT family acetyltransferase